MHWLSLLSGMKELSAFSVLLCYFAGFFFFFWSSVSFLPLFRYLLSLLAEDLNSALRETSHRMGALLVPFLLLLSANSPFLPAYPHLFSISQSKSTFLSVLRWSFNSIGCVWASPPPTNTYLFPGQPQPHAAFLNCMPSSALLPLRSNCGLNMLTYIPHGFLKFSMSKAGIFISLWKICSFLCFPHGAE